MRKNCKAEGHDELPRDHLGGHSNAVALPQDTQHQQPQAPQTYRESVQQGIQRKHLPAQAPSYMLQVATAVQQIFAELSEVVSEKDKIMIITKMILNLER
jgi:hypothetical protein